MLFQLRKSLRSSVSIFKVVRLNVVNEVLVNLLMAIRFRLVYFGIRCDIVCIMSFAQHQMSALCSNILVLKLLILILRCAASYCVVRCGILISITTSSNREMRSCRL